VSRLSLAAALGGSLRWDQLFVLDKFYDSHWRGFSWLSVSQTVALCAADFRFELISRGSCFDWGCKKGLGCTRAESTAGESLAAIDTQHRAGHHGIFRERLKNFRCGGSLRCPASARSRLMASGQHGVFAGTPLRDTRGENPGQFVIVPVNGCRDNSHLRARSVRTRDPVGCRVPQLARTGVTDVSDCAALLHHEMPPTNLVGWGDLPWIGSTGTGAFHEHRTADHAPGYEQARRLGQRAGMRVGPAVPPVL